VEGIVVDLAKKLRSSFLSSAESYQSSAGIVCQCSRKIYRAALRYCSNARAFVTTDASKTKFMTRKIISFIFVFGLAAITSISVMAAASPTPTPTPKKKSFLKPTVNPSATPSKAGAALGRGGRIGADRPLPSATPKATATPKSKAKASPSPARKKSPTPTATPGKTTKSPTPNASASPKKETSPKPQPSPTPPPSPSPSPVETVSPTPTATPAESVAASTPTPPSKLELTLTKFEPPHGKPGDPDYRSARLSYRINVPSKMEFPAIDFAVESSSGKLFERHFALPAGSAFIEPGDATERSVALDAASVDNWADVYAKSENAKFTWSIEGQGSGEIEKSVKKSWP
jgi:hypothetical protein